MTLNIFLAISNHAAMIGGGEYSFSELLSKLPRSWRPIAALPGEGELKDRLDRNGIETVIVPLHTIRTWKWPGVLKSCQNLTRLCRDVQPAFIYANGSRAALYAGLVGKILRLPVIWHCRITDKEFLDRVLTRLCTRVVVNSAATAARFPKRWQSKVHVVYNGLDLAWLNHPEVEKQHLVQKDGPIILVVARVSRWKRHELVLDAFESVATQIDNVQLVLIGGRDDHEPGWWDELQERSGKSQFAKQIHWVGHCTDVRPWYRSASVFALASDNESFGRVVVEAMASGVPVVATRSGGVPEIVRHNRDGLLVEPGSSRSMADALLRLLSNDDLRKQMGAAAKERALNFSLDRHVANMIRVFEETAGRRR